MPVSLLHPPAVIPKLSPLGRFLAGAQVLKETLSIIFLGLPLVKAGAKKAPPVRASSSSKAIKSTSSSSERGIRIRACEEA